MSGRDDDAPDLTLFEPLDAPTPGDLPPDTTPVDPEILDTVSEGLDGGSPGRKHVVVIGAGLAGLVAAFELKRQGHRVTVLEAQNRVGGRIYTLRAPFAPGLYAEAGGMRIPRAHDLTLALLRAVRAADAAVRDGQPQGRWSTSAAPRMTQGAGRRRPRAAAVRARRQRARPDRGRAVGGGDRRPARGWSRPRAPPPGTTSWPSTTSTRSTSSCARRAGRRARSSTSPSSTSSRPTCTTRSSRSCARTSAARTWTCRRSWAAWTRCPTRSTPHLADEIRFGAERVRHRPGRRPGSRSTPRPRPAGSRSRADYAVVTVPFSVLRTIEVLTPFSRGKQRAIRQLNYHASTKILFQVRERIWETEDGILGGGDRHRPADPAA